MECRTFVRGTSISYLFLHLRSHTDTHTHNSKGELHNLRRYISKHPDFNFQINTFGFGYSLDSELLCNLAKEGHGSFTFIPNACVVGTVFVHSLSNAVATLAQKCKIVLQPLRDDVKLESNTIDLSPLQFGQTRSAMVRVKPLKHYGGGPHLRATTVTVLPTGAVQRESRMITLKGGATHSYSDTTKSSSSRVDVWRKCSLLSSTLSNDNSNIKIR